MKNMGVEDEGEGIYNFWLSASADGAKIKQIRQTTEREASSKANFPGFRKVCYCGYTFRFCEQRITSLYAYVVRSLPVCLCSQ